MVDAVLAECGAGQERLRKLPAGVVVYLLLAGAVFEECGYPCVWSELTVAAGSLPVLKVTATALWHAWARLGNARHFEEYQRPISAETLRRRLHVGAARSRMLVAELRSQGPPLPATAPGGRVSVDDPVGLLPTRRLDRMAHR